MRLKDKDKYRAKVDIHGPVIVVKGTEMIGSQWKIALKNHKNLEKNLSGLLKNLSLERNKENKKVPLNDFMPTTQKWIARARKDKATHLIIVQDKVSFNNYPVFVRVNEDIERRKKEYNLDNDQEIKEIIDLSKVQL